MDKGGWGGAMYNLAINLWYFLCSHNIILFILYAGVCHVVLQNRTRDRLGRVNG